MIYGYARVSTTDQSMNLQTDSLKKAGCKKLFCEKISGSKIERPELKKLLAALKPGDTVTVWKLDRLGRSLKDLIKITTDFNSMGVGFISLQDSINTQTAQGRFFFHVIASLSELERELIRERTFAGLDAARARGRKGGRPKGLSEHAQLKALHVKKMYLSKKYTLRQIMDKFKISKPTIYTYLKAETPDFQ